MFKNVCPKPGTHTPTAKDELALQLIAEADNLEVNGEVTFKHSPPKIIAGF